MLDCLFNKYYQIDHEESDQRCKKESNSHEWRRKKSEKKKKGREKERMCNSASRCGIMHGGVHGAAFNPAITEISV